MKRKIKVYFTDFWKELEINDNFILDFLKVKYEVIIDKENPDFLIYSCFGADFLNYNCVRIFYTGENIRPNFDNCDWAFSCDFLDSERNFRMPNYIYFCGDLNQVTVPKPPIDEIIKQKTKFCNFVYSNPACRKRNNFFHKLSKYKTVDSAGRYLNNTKISLENKVDKVEFLKSYKFTIAFENSEYNGYTTEKIFEPFIANSIPIYWGNPLVYKDFNTKSFLNYYDFPNEKALIDKIIEIDNNDELLAKYLSESAFINNELNEFVKPENILAQFDKIINANIIPVAKKISSKPVTVRNLNIKKKKLDFKIAHLLYRIKTFRLAKIKMKLMKKREKSLIFQKNEQK